MEVYDMETFISEIEAHPTIWDIRVLDYSNREKRTEAWNEVFLKTVPDFGEKTVKEKNSVAKKLRRKWKSLRDCFKREYKKRLKALKGPVTPTGKPYKYYDNLTFLINVTKLEGRPLVNLTTADLNPPVTKEAELLDLLTMETERKKRKMNEISEREFLQSFAETYAITQTEIEDADRNFVLSLLPHFKQISYEYKLEAQVEILMVLKKYKTHGEQRFECFSEAQPGEEESIVFSEPKLSPPSSEDGQAMSDDSSINEDLYY